mmetsp:Transcript_50243/g.83641  ORF Transcript_50243/g.83641 Transcript_50243/m.83641 type:complete len:221 (+) Transcript_50243:1343-2005(+)
MRSRDHQIHTPLFFVRLQQRRIFYNQFVIYFNLNFGIECRVLQLCDPKRSARPITELLSFRQPLLQDMAHNGSQSTFSLRAGQTQLLLDHRLLLLVDTKDADAHFSAHKHEQFMELKIIAHARSKTFAPRILFAQQSEIAAERHTNFDYARITKNTVQKLVKIRHINHLRSSSSRSRNALLVVDGLQIKQHCLGRGGHLQYLAVFRRRVYREARYHILQI